MPKQDEAGWQQDILVASPRESTSNALDSEIDVVGAPPACIRPGFTVVICEFDIDVGGVVKLQVLASGGSTGGWLMLGTGTV